MSEVERLEKAVFGSRNGSGTINHHIAMGSINYNKINKSELIDLLFDARERIASDGHVVAEGRKALEQADIRRQTAEARVTHATAVITSTRQSVITMIELKAPGADVCADPYLMRNGADEIKKHGKQVRFLLYLNRLAREFLQ